MKIALIAAFAALFAQTQAPPLMPGHGAKKGVMYAMSVSTSLPPIAAGAPTLDGMLGTVEIQSNGQPAGVLPAVVRIERGGQLALVEYNDNGQPIQTFRCTLPFNGKVPQAIVAVGDDKNGFDDVLAGVLTKSSIGFDLRFDQRIRIANGKMSTAFATGPIKGFVEILFDSTVPGA